MLLSFIYYFRVDTLSQKHINKYVCVHVHTYIFTRTHTRNKKKRVAKPGEWKNVVR